MRILEGNLVTQGLKVGIVVGRLQHDKILGWNIYDDLKQRYRWIN